MWFRVAPYVAVFATLACVFPASAQDMIDLSDATVVAPQSRPVQLQAARMLVAEVREGTGLSWREVTAPEPDTPAIVLGSVEDFPGDLPSPPAGMSAPQAAEGFAMWVDATPSAPRVYLVGRDDRGVMFAAGRLLRLLAMNKGEALLASNTRLATAPQYPVRGHQIGFRAVNNTYDKWTLEQYEQYLRDLIRFGTNSIELTSSMGDAKANEHMIESPATMNPKLAKLFASYGMDVWVWIGVGDIKNPADADRELEEQRRYFATFSVLDHVFVPGGDPGSNAPQDLLPFLARMAAMLREVHPKAKLWLSNQGFDHDENDYLFSYLNDHQPRWLAGLVFGPWTHITLAETRARTPKQYPIRRYPDICHSVRCEYPVSHWDRAFAFTLGREPFNPRPLAHAHIHNALAKDSVGFISYSDGATDDVNKIVWNALSWDPSLKVEDILKDYARAFVSVEHADAIAKGLLMLEANWAEPLLDNEGVDATLDHWKKLEAKAPEIRNNWRFEQCLLRATYDAFTRRRLAVETEAEAKATAALAKAGETGVAEALRAARAALNETALSPEAASMKRKIEELGQRLFEHIGMQLDVKRYKALNPERGAILEFLETPLNNRDWLLAEMDAIQKTSDKAAQLARIDGIVNWEHPGEGSFYDDLGNAWKQPHVVPLKTWKEDPGFIESVQNEFQNAPADQAWRLSWRDQAQTLYGTPLTVRYEGLDANATYRVRVTYAGRFSAQMRLTADGAHVLHEAPKEGEPPLQQKPPVPVEFDIPAEATRDGRLDLTWDLATGRGCQVAEVWLLRK